MGRRKVVPRHQSRDGPCEVLGRTMWLQGCRECHDSSTATFIATTNNNAPSLLERLHWMLTEEAVLPDPVEVTEELLELRDTDDDETDAEQIGRDGAEWNPKKRKRRVGGSSTLSIRRKSLRTTRTRKRPRKESRKNAVRSKRVRFGDDEQGPIHAAMIPFPELEVLQMNDEHDYFDKSAILVLFYSFHAKAASYHTEFILLRIPILVHTEIEVIEYPTETQTNRLPIRTRGGVTVALRSVGCLDYSSNKNNNNLNNHNKFSFLRAVEDAVTRDNTVSLELVMDDSKRWCLEVGLTTAAFEISFTGGITNRRRNSKFETQSSHPVDNLRKTLAFFFPDTMLADTCTVPSSQDFSESVTAKQVYALTDNLQLRNRSSLSNGTTLNIPGLIPTLRPYQEHAVRWMLERECSPGLQVPSNMEGAIINSKYANEWKLAWIVLNESMNPVALLALEPDFPVDNPLLLFCPFTGWLARSIREAQSMTLPEMWQPTKGGILAESMGLGKTVEVLACILANRCPPATCARAPSKREGCASEYSRSSAVCRKISFEDLRNEADEARSIRSTDDVNSFEGPHRSKNADAACNHSPSIDSACTTVTPEKSGIHSLIQQRWIDDDVIGSCICSNPITFVNREAIVVCEGCDEPMHKKCASFLSEDEYNVRTKPFHLYQRFTNRILECRICEKEFCPSCVAIQNEKIKSCATLIITPAAILNQWMREIKRHTCLDGEPLTVIVYDGINRICSRNRENVKYLHPRHLVEADIVLMTFDSLLGDLGHSDDNKFAMNHSSVTSTLRSKKKYRVVPSPLQSIFWWRVCLDEAQKVEMPTAGSSRMALKLESEHRWCVSGTPISRGKLDDLYGLLLFLRVEPFNDKRWFNKCFCTKIRGVHERISHLLKDIFWRSTKAYDVVKNQMGVPEQIEDRIFLEFSSIEKHFYDRQLEETLCMAGDLVRPERSRKTWSNSQLHLLAEHLHRLRAACCHPQVGSSGICQVTKKRVGQASKSNEENYVVSGLAARVMTMSQILDRFIDDAKQKCEEAQRLAILHTNGMAAISRLKIEAKDRGIPIQENDDLLLRKSCSHYSEALQLGEENAKPSLVLGEAVLSGSVGFLSQNRRMRNGVFVADWKYGNDLPDDMWTVVDFEMSARKIVQIRARSRLTIPQDLAADTSERCQWIVLFAKDVVVQVSSVAVGGDYIDVAKIALPKPSNPDDEQWMEEGGFLTNKSKNWRLMIKSWHSTDHYSTHEVSVGYYLGLEIELYEADIAYDPLQRLHCLHNACQSFEMFLQVNRDSDDTRSQFCCTTLETMKKEAITIETLYLAVDRGIHQECSRRLVEETMARKKLEKEIFKLSRKDGAPALSDCWDDKWWDDFLVLVTFKGSETQQKFFCERVFQDMDGYLQSETDLVYRDGIIPFPEFRDIHGFRIALTMRIDAIRMGLGGRASRTSKTAFRAASAFVDDEAFSGTRDIRFRCPPGAHSKHMAMIGELTAHPDDMERYENSHCKVCKADWFQTGPKCRHCGIGEALEEIGPDRVTLLLLNSIHGLLKGAFGTALLRKSQGHGIRLAERAKTFFDILDNEKRELTAAWRMWRCHLNLLNHLDELTQCKRALRLTGEGEDLSQIPEEQLNAVVVPIDINARYHEHSARQAMALGDLRRAKDTLRFLRNQSYELLEQETAVNSQETSDRCVICLSEFGNERAVLCCGHSFHLKPCLENIKARFRSSIPCPMRCKIRTDPQDVMIATTKRGDDGSRSRRAVKGSWGTKVTRLVADVLDVRDLGEKCVIFSQWEDMLDIVQQALAENGVSAVRATGRRQIGISTDTFLRQKDCTALLLNVKNGAEGLTLLEATHVFMIEPLLNPGLDSQAINRVHRIGQNKKTYVHRYLITNTIEMKIDKLRAEHQEQLELEDDDEMFCSSRPSSLFRAGGIDGGFESQEELWSILQPDENGDSK